MLGLRLSPAFALLLLTGCGRSILLLPGVGEDESGSGDSGEATSVGVSEESGSSSGACGDGVAGDGELCDGKDLGAWSCLDLGFDGGELYCTPGCMLDATGCWQDGDSGPIDSGPATSTGPGTTDTGPTDTGPGDTCGNGVIDGFDEECDGADFGGLNCVDLGFGPGLPLCTIDCKFDLSTCPPLPPPEGQPCNWNTPCPGGLNCVFGTCYDGSPGDPCTNDGECQSNFCVPSQWGQDTCN